MTAVKYEQDRVTGNVTHTTQYLDFLPVIFMGFIILMRNG